jgi:hypothetical protein
MRKIRGRMESTGAPIDDAPTPDHAHRLHTEVNTVVVTENQEIANTITREVEVGRRTAVTRTTTPVDDTLVASLNFSVESSVWCAISIDIL